MRKQTGIKLLKVARWLLLVIALLSLSNVYFDLKDSGLSFLDVFGFGQSNVSYYEARVHGEMNRYLSNTYITPSIFMLCIALLLYIVQKGIEKQIITVSASKLHEMTKRQRLILRGSLLGICVVGGPVTLLLIATWLVPLWLLVEFKYGGSK